jgi:hypothetical protein
VLAWGRVDSAFDYRSGMPDYRYPEDGRSKLLRTLRPFYQPTRRHVLQSIVSSYVINNFSPVLLVTCAVCIRHELKLDKVKYSVKVSHGVRVVAGGMAPRPGRFTPGTKPVPILQEAGWASGPVWTGTENLAFTGIRSLDRPSRSWSLYFTTLCHKVKYCRAIKKKALGMISGNTSRIACTSR